MLHGVDAVYLKIQGRTEVPQEVHVALSLRAETKSRSDYNMTSPQSAHENVAHE